MILPIPDIVIEAKKRGIKTIIDGAHVPAHIPLDIKELDPDYYTGALHKWLCCPKGISFLYVKKEYQEGIQPMVKSWGWGEEYEKFKSSIQLHSPSRFINVFQWQGTTDMSAFFTVPEAIQFQNKYDWKTVRSRCFDMVIEARNRITDITKLPKICPDSWLGHMATILFPIEDTASFKKTLYNDYQIEIPVMSHKDNTAFRISVQGYNSEADIDHLINSLEELI
jgi:isopenicillin-N epimerase